MAEKPKSLRKAAILMVSLDTDAATKIMASLDKETIERLTLEIARLDDVETEEQNAIVEEFYMLGMARKYIEQGGINYAQELLERTLDAEDAKTIVEQIRLSLESAPFSFLKKTPPETLTTFLTDEHPQTVAVVLAHLLPKQASLLLQSLPASKQLEVTKRIATMEQTSPEMIREVERSLEKRLASVVSAELEQAGGAQSVAQILNFADRATERAILENLDAENPDLVEEVRRLMFVFEDIALVDQKGMQEVLKEIDNDTLALALKGASEELGEKFFSAMSSRAGELVKENMEFLGAVRVADVEGAQQDVVDTVRRLIDSGAVSIRERGAEEELII